MEDSTAAIVYQLCISSPHRSSKISNQVTVSRPRFSKSFYHCDYCHKFWILKLVGSAAVWSLIFSLYSIIHLVCVFLFNIFCRWGMPNEVDEETFFVAIQLGYAALQKVAMIVLVKIVGDSFISNLTKWATFVIASPRLLVFIEACSDIHKSIQRLLRELENRPKKSYFYLIFSAKIQIILYSIALIRESLFTF